MKTAMWRWTVAVLIGLFHAHAVGEPRTALVIGNAAYKQAPLRNPTHDAEDMAQALRELGFEVTLQTNATQRTIKQALRDFGQGLKRGGVGLFYFAGHGVQSRNRNYLIPIDANIESEAELEDQAVDANLVLAYMEEAQNRVNVVILDACRNNPFTRTFRSAARGLAQMDAARGSFVAFATAPGSVASDGTGRNGLYTERLLTNLRAGDPDIDKVFRRVAAEVSAVTAGKQIPWVASSLTGDFVFRSVGSATSAAQQASNAPTTADLSAEIAFWESIKESKRPEEFATYLAQYPSGRFAAIARVRQKGLEDAARITPQDRFGALEAIAYVNGVPVLKLAYDEVLKEVLSGGKYKDDEKTRSLVVQELVNREVLVQSANSAGLGNLVPDPAKLRTNVEVKSFMAQQAVLVRAYIDRLMADHPVTDAALELEYQRKWPPSSGGKRPNFAEVKEQLRTSVAGERMTALVRDRRVRSDIRVMPGYVMPGY